MSAAAVTFGDACTRQTDAHTPGRTRQEVAKRARRDKKNALRLRHFRFRISLTQKAVAKAVGIHSTPSNAFCAMIMRAAAFSRLFYFNC
jgi:hypothetical protein